jgi:hypothetical protein
LDKKRHFLGSVYGIKRRHQMPKKVKKDLLKHAMQQVNLLICKSVHDAICYNGKLESDSDEHYLPMK